MESLATLLDLVYARRRLATRVDEALGVHHGLALGDLALLLELRDAGGRMRRTDLASRLGITPSGVARQVAPLERIGLVGREPGRDARVALVTLTETGSRVAAEALVTGRESAESALAAVWAPREQERLGVLLRKARV